VWLALAAPEPGNAARLLAARIESIFERLTAIALVNVLNAGLITFVLCRHGVRADAIIWLVLVASLGLSRVLAYRHYQRDGAKVEHTRHWTRVAVLGSLFSGVLWGGGAMILFSPNPTDQWLWSLAIGGMCAGATSLHAAHLPTALSFSIPACLPLLTRLSLQGTDQDLAAAALIIAFIVVTTFTATRFSAQFGETFLLQLTLEQQTSELDETNRRLRREMEEHRRTSESLHQSQKMEALGSLTGGIAHDFNNLLAVILGNLDLIHRRSKDARVTPLAKSAMEAVESGAALISSLLSFARKQSLRPQPADINALIRDFHPLLLHAAGNAVKFEIDCAEQDAPALIDMAQLQAALLNLVINARDAISEDGRISISTSHIAIEEAEAFEAAVTPGDFIRIEVADNGSGMSSTVASKAFEPFFTTKDVGKGSGLGLSQIYGFALQSGGFARIDSAPDAGTRVSLFIPRMARAKTSPTPQRIEPSLPSNRHRVLLVDDNSDVLVTLREGLIEDGWDVMIAQDADAAMLMLERYEDIDLLVADVDMPVGISGLELVRQAKQRWPDLPAVLISGLTDTAHDLPADVPFIAKPFTFETFSKTLASVAEAA
jgi:signal transduction histidine kinase